MKKYKKTSNEFHIKLLERIKRKDQEAFEKFYALSHDYLVNFANRLVFDLEVAEECAQETYATLWTKAHTFRGESAVLSWVFCILKNHCMMYLRKKQRIERLVIPDNIKGWELTDIDHHSDDSIFEVQVKKTASKIPCATEIIEAKEQIARLDKALRRLPDIYAEVFFLRAVQGYQVPKIAKHLGVSIPAVKSRYHRAKESLERWKFPNINPRFEARNQDNIPQASNA